MFSRGLTAGERLPSERDLAEALGTSRPALREAVRLLVARGVIEVRGRSGIYIASPDVNEVFAVRIQLEPLAAQLAATLRTTPELRALQQMVRDLRRSTADPVTFSAVDRRLHRTVAGLSGNAVLADLILQLGDLTLITRGTTAREDEARAGTVTDMAELVSAIRARDGSSAATAMRVHLQRIQGVAARDALTSRLPERLALRL